MKRGIVLFAVITAALIAVCISLLGTAFPSETIRYRLTLEAEIDGNPAVGSGVIQVKQFDTTGVFGSMGGAGAEINGEAVVLDLGRSGPVFALLRGAIIGLWEPPSSLAFRAFRDTFGQETDPLAQIRMLQRERPRREVPPEYLPMAAPKLIVPVMVGASIDAAETAENCSSPDRNASMMDAEACSRCRLAGPA